MKMLLGLSLLFSIAKIQANEMAKSMAGCYDVTFEYTEINSDPKYPIKSPYYLEHAREMIVLDKETADEVHLQHMLIVGNVVIKHWREEWYKSTTQNTFTEFTAPGVWTQKASPMDENSWIQYVSNVDDAPRYGCSAAWIGSSWECKTLAPVPRREMSIRKDYQVLDRRNKLVITNKGWIHFELNDKLKIAADGTSQIISQEIGSNRYEKTTSDKCDLANQMWASEKMYWNLIQDMWKHVAVGHSPLKLKTMVDGQTFGMKADAIIKEWMGRSFDKTAFEKEIHDLIHLYMM